MRNRQKYTLKILLCLLLSFAVKPVFALTFPLPTPKEALVGKAITVISKKDETLSLIGMAHDIGLLEMRKANPQMRLEALKIGSRVRIPSAFILPDVPRKGMVINLAEMRLYYYQPKKKQVTTYPIGIGRVGWATPVSSLHIIEKTKNPIWRVPKTIAMDSKDRGHPLPEFIKSGPDNPLGYFAMRLSNPAYLIHGTNQPEGVGTRTTAGCIRLLPEDIKVLFRQVAIGTKVRIINQPYKVGWSKGVLYLESHFPLNEDREDMDDTTTLMFKKVMETVHNSSVDIDWDKLYEVTDSYSGIPSVIGHSLSDR